jgi:glutamine synthetase
MSAFAVHAAAFMANNPDIEIVECVFPDMNGQMRGKWIPARQIDKLAKGSVRMPMSTYNLDIASEDVAEAHIAVEVGDPDGVGWPIPHSFGRALWAERPTAVALMTMTGPDGETPCAYDPRQVLARVVKRFSDKGITPVVAPELEFYFVDGETDEAGRARPPVGVGGDRLTAPQIYLLDVKSAFSGVLADIDAAAKALGAPAEAATAEFGPGQFEINLGHVADPLAAADHAIMLRRAVRGVARQHGMDACFMAKPYGDQSGSGQHFHVSLVDAEGRNLFDAGDADDPNPRMRAAVGGLIETMADSTLLFAPHLNSYRRLRPGTYAPHQATWGLDNRGVAVRCPAIHGPAARLEHRVAGADSNPYLALAAILAGMLRGLERDADPGEPLEGEARVGSGGALPTHWPAAISAFEASAFVRDAIGAEFQRVYALMKRQELNRLLERVTDAEYDTYLRTL